MTGIRVVFFAAGNPRLHKSRMWTYVSGLNIAIRSDTCGTVVVACARRTACTDSLTNRSVSCTVRFFCRGLTAGSSCHPLPWPADLQRRMTVMTDFGISIERWLS